MAEMPSSERQSPDTLFRKLEAVLAELRAAVMAPPGPAKSWTKRGAAGSERQREFNTALMSVLTETLHVLRVTAANQETRFEEVAREISEVRSDSENIDAFRERIDRLETELRSAAANVRGLQERAAALETALAQARDEQAERIQHVLDEQRVSIRQLALQASEAAVLADRARRATELKLEELARRIAPPPA